MGFWGTIMKAGMKKDDIADFYDVTSKCKIKNIKKKYNSIKIQSCLDIRFSYKQDNPKCSVFLKDVNDLNNLEINFIEENRELHLHISSRKAVKGYLELVTCCVGSLDVVSDQDISVKYVASEHVVLSSAKGDIYALVNEADVVELNADSGDITVDILRNEYLIDAHTKSGEVILNKVKSNNNANHNIHCVSKSGDIVISLLKK